MLQKKKTGLLAAALLAVMLFFGLSSAALAASYELDRIDLYDYYDDDSHIRISGSYIEEEMSKTVDWRRVRIVPRTVDGYVEFRGDGSEYDDDWVVTLDEDETAEVKIDIYDKKGGDRQKRYYLYLTRSSSGVSKVTFTGDDFTKTFDSPKGSNTLKIPMDEDELRLKAYLDNSDDYYLECNGETSRNNSWDISIPKNRTVTVELTVYDDNDRRVKEIEFDITRSSDVGSNVYKPDLLNRLRVKADGTEYDLFPSFDENTHEYIVCFRSDVRNAVIIPSFGSDAKSCKIDGVTVRDGNESSELKVSTGGSTYTMKITDDDGDTYNYSITLKRTSLSSGNSTGLERLRIKRGDSKSESSMTEIDSEPGFDEYVYRYDLYAGSSNAYFSFRPRLEDSDGLVVLSTPDKLLVLDNDTYSTGVKLGDNDTAVLRVYSPNYREYKDYTFNINERKLDRYAYLDSLDLYVDGVKVAITPSFDSKTFSYTASVGKNVGVFSVTPTTQDSTSTVTVMGDKVKSGHISSEYSIGNNFTNIPIVVTAEDGSTNTYRLILSRADSTTENPNGNLDINTDVKVVLRIGSTNYISDGKIKTLSAAPYIVSGRTQVPLRVIAEALGAGVNYNNAAKQITINLGAERLYMDIGKVIKDFDVAPEIRESTTFVPIRYVVEKMGCECTYNSASKEVVITVK